MSNHELARLAALTHGPLGGSAHHVGQWLVILWTAKQGGRLDPVALTIEPWPVLDDEDDRLGAELAERLGQEAHRLTVIFEVLGSLPVLSTAALRGIPITKLIAARSDIDALHAAANAHNFVMILPVQYRMADGEAVGLKQDDLGSLDYIPDAFLFAHAVAEGNRRPVVYVQEKLGHGSRQTTQNRLNVARKLGLLTPTQRGKASGELTPKGQRLAETMLKFNEAHHANLETDNA